MGSKTLSHKSIPKVTGKQNASLVIVHSENASWLDGIFYPYGKTYSNIKFMRKPYLLIIEVIISHSKKKKKKNYINTHRCIPLVNFSNLECVCIKYTFCYLPF